MLNNVCNNTMENCTEKYNVSYLDFYKICRICMLVKNDMIHMNNNEDVIKKIYNFTSITINLNDGLPSQLCNDCSLSLEKCYKFKKECEKSNDILKQIQNKYLQQRHSGTYDAEKNSIVNYSEICNKTSQDDEIKEECSNDYSDLWEDDKSDLKNAIYDVQAVITTPKSESNANNDTDISSVNINSKNVIRLRKKGKKIVKKQVRKSKRHFNISEKQSKETSRKKESSIFDPEKCDESTFTCKICNRTFASKQSLKKHLERHSENRQKTHTCKICGKTFYQSSHLFRHMKNHSMTTEPCFCTYCNKWLKDKEILKAHIRYVHQGARKKETCLDCGATVVDIKAHTFFVHATERPYQCSKCDKAFAKECFLKSHIKARHTEVRREVRKMLCTLCGKILVNSSRFRIHMHSHTGERPYKCSLCDKSYMGKRGLKAHMHNHTGERPFECSTCHKRYVTKRILQIHQLVHTGEKPHQCIICGQAFRQKSTLWTHTKLIHTGEKRNQCNICGENFSQKSTLKAHMKIH